MEKPSWLATGRGLAEKATKGKWTVCPEGEYIFANGQMVAEVRGIGAGLDTEANARHISAHDPETMLGIYKLVEEMEDALDHVQHFCICDRDVKGFDYSEEHKYMGKPGSGKRWRTPCDVAEPALAAYHAGPKKGGEL